MRKNILVFTISLLLIVLAACGGNKVDEATAEKYTAKAEDVILLLNEGDYEAAFELFNEEMKQGLPVSAMKQLTPIIEESGSYQEIDKASVEEKDGLYVSVLRAKYSEKNRVYTITFDSNDEVAGLFLK